MRFAVIDAAISQVGVSIEHSTATFERLNEVLRTSVADSYLDLDELDLDWEAEFEEDDE